MILLVLAAAAGVAAPEAAPSPEPPRFEATFDPTGKFKRYNPALGPVGPYYPERAYGDRRNGDVVLACLTGTAGVLEQCKVLRESPSNYSFGIAAIVMARRKQIIIDPSAPAGEPVMVHVPFTLGVRAAAAP